MSPVGQLLTLQQLGFNDRSGSISCRSDLSAGTLFATLASALQI
jgi:hypothetical protein